MKKNLKTCPACDSFVEFIEESDHSCNMIVCGNYDCPMGIEHSDMDYAQLAKIWNDLPRREQQARVDTNNNGW